MKISYPVYIPLSLTIATVLFGYLLHKLYIRTDSKIMAHTGLLIVSNISKAIKSLSRACQHVNSTLYISINCNQDYIPNISQNITNFYTKSTAICNDLDVRLLLKPSHNNRIDTRRQVDLVLYENNCLQSDVKNYAENHILNLKADFKIVSLDLSDFDGEDRPIRNVANGIKKYEYVALGGTFDRLHNGHKVLLTEAVVRCTKHLTVGVTDVNMIQSKKLWELIQPVSERISKLRDFLEDINPDIEYNICPIQDIYGPTKDDPRYQLLVVSQETKVGGEMVNKKRLEAGLSELDIHVIDLAEDKRKSTEEEEKISSSNRRMRLLGTILNKPKPNHRIPRKPYVIGLSGGVAAGKTKITERMIKMGAAVVNCDLIAHELYKPGLPLNGTIAATFGSDILLESGEINRRKLGQIVFADKSKLEKLNSIMWPAILDEARLRIAQLGREGFKVVVMEAAVLLQAGWSAYCHQVWAVIIPPKEAIKRLMERNKLSEEEAKRRVDAQPSNIEQVEAANIVFSPFWSYEYTQSQLDRAWKELQPYLDQSTSKM